MNNPYYYTGPNPTVDLIIERNDKICLVQRSDTSPACPNQWALPGGFIDSKASKSEAWKEGLETPEVASVRECFEETGIRIPKENIKFVGIYEGNGRDPRDNPISWSKSHAFYCKIDDEFLAQNSFDAQTPEEISDLKWFTLDEIKSMPIAFDHLKIILDSPFAKSKKHKLNF